MKLKHIDIVSIPVRDQQAARNFYTKMLGFKVVRDDPMGPSQRWIQLAPPGAETSISLVTWFEAMPAGSVQGLVLGTDDIDAAQAELTQRGVRVSPVRREAWGRFATFNDPDGNGWVLAQSLSS